MKGSGKDSYTLRFASDDKAQEWRRAFELMAKVKTHCFCNSCLLNQHQHRCMFPHSLLQHVLVVTQKIDGKKTK
jgi:hypothetical protein